MRRDPLQRLLRLRQQAVEEARRALTAGLRAEAEAAAVRDSIKAQAARDRTLESALLAQAPNLLAVAALGRDRLVDRQAQADIALYQAEQEAARRRQLLVEQRTQAEAVAAVVTERNAEKSRQAEAKMSHALDDMSRTRFRKRHTAGMDPD